MILFKPRVGKVIFAQTTGELCVIIPIIIKKKWEMKREYGQKEILMLFIANRTSANHKNWPIVIVFALAA